MSGVTDFLFGGSDQSSGSQQTSTSQLDPRVFNLYNQNLQRATSVANNLGPRQFAGYTPDYNAGANTVRNTVLGGEGLNTVGYGADVAKRVGMGNINPGSFLDTNMGAYMNPYLQNVAGNTINDMYRAREMQGLADNAAASRAGAFGGSRHGVVESETNRNFYDRLSNSLGNIYATGYQNASNMANQDLNRSLQAQTSNQQSALTSAALLRDLGLTQQQMGLQGGQALANLGLGQQQLSQAQLDAIRNLPIEQQNIINAAIGLNPAGGSGMTTKSSGTSSSSGSSSEGLFDGIGGMIGTAMFLSDERMKENAKQISDPLSKLNKIDGMQFNYRNSPFTTAGVMAQDVESVLPSAVEDVGVKMVNYPEVTGLLVEAVKELAKKQKRG